MSCKFGFGILNQGEIVTDLETHRLIAKRAWLQLWQYLSQNDEMINASRIPVPWSLHGDHDIVRALKESNEQLARFKSEEAYIAFSKTHENEKSQKDPSVVQGVLEVQKTNERSSWVINQVTSELPLTVLDIGSGYGNIAIALARRGISVTALNLIEGFSEGARRYLEENKETLPIDWIYGSFETADFGSTKFDVVYAGEIIEHVPNDRAFLEKCLGLARHAVVITTPAGSCDNGFAPKAQWRMHNQHVRAYSEDSFKFLIESTLSRDDVKKIIYPTPRIHLTSCTDLQGNFIYCFGAKILKETSNAEPARIERQAVPAS